MLMHAEPSDAAHTRRARLFCLSLLVAERDDAASCRAFCAVEHPEQRARSRRSPIPGGGGGLRWVTRSRRSGGPPRATEVAGVPVPADAFVIMLYAGANRDDTVFGTDRRRFDVTRPVDPPHLAFGFGEHLCLRRRAPAWRHDPRRAWRSPSGRWSAPDWAPSTLVRGCARCHAASIPG
jgi:hypothetical protein